MSVAFLSYSIEGESNISLIRKIYVANFWGLILPLGIYSILSLADAYDNVVVGIIYLAHIITPFIFLIIIFRADGISQGFAEKLVFKRTIIASITWAIAISLESYYSDYIDVAIFPAIAINLFGNIVLPSSVPEMNYLNPLYEPIYRGLVLLYDIAFLSLSVFWSHCGKSGSGVEK